MGSNKRRETGNPALRRILMTTDPIGGVWNYSLELCRMLGRYNIQVGLAVIGGLMNDNQKKEILGLNNVRLYPSNYKLEWMENPWDDVEKTSKWLLKIRDKFKPDLVHLNCFSFGNLEWGVPCLVVAHSDVLSWWRSVKGEEAPGSWDTYREKISSGIYAADSLVAPSGFMLNEVRKFAKPSALKRVIYNSRNNHFHRRRKEKIIFSVGRIWDEAKNMRCLIKASPLMKWPIYAAGETGTFLKSFSEDLTRKIFFLGNISSKQITNYYSRASIFVHTAKYEPFGLAPLEAALSGCTLVLSDIPSLREIWEDNALFINPDDPKHLADAVNFLAKDPDFRDEYAHRAMMHARKFSEQRMISEYLSLYRYLLEFKSVNKVKV